MTEEDTFEALQLRVVIDKFGDKRYYNSENQLHRKFGPAVVCYDGSEMWFLYGNPHRTDGAAIKWSFGTKQWHINGEHLTEEDFLKHPFCTIKK